MQSWIIYVMNTFGYVGIALLITLENIFPPIPSEVILTFGGFMTTYTSMSIPGVVLSSTLGSVAGAIILYKVGSLLSQERLEKLLDGKIGRFLHFKKENVGQTITNFNQYGTSTVFFCRFIPIIRSLISIPAGMAKMAMGKFLFFTTIGSLIWNTLLIGLGAIAGVSWQIVFVYIDSYGHILLIAFGITLLSAYLFNKLKD